MRYPVVDKLLWLLLCLTLLATPVSAAPLQQTPDPPTPLTPADGASLTPLSHPPLAIPNFTWEENPNAAAVYDLQIARDIGFTAPVAIEVLNTPNARYTPTKTAFTPLTDGAFYWRVRAKIGSSVGAWSAIFSFTKTWATPENAPVLTQPAVGTVLESVQAPAFRWQPVLGAAYYKLYVDNDADMSSPFLTVDEAPAETYQPIEQWANGTYYWRVVPYDVAAHPGTASEIRSFTLSYGKAPFAPPQLLAPANGSETLFTPRFDWQAMPGARSYILQYSTDATFQTGVTQKEIHGTSYVPDTQLPNDVNIYWRVQVRAGTSAYSDWSNQGDPAQAWRFIKRWNLAPQLLTPTNNYIGVHQSPFLSWTPVPGAAYYRVQAACDQGFTLNARQADVVHPYYMFPAWDNLWGCSTWFWRVTPFHQSNAGGVSSATFSFSLAAVDLTPALYFPLHYYTPDARFATYHVPTATLPIFGWSWGVNAALTETASLYRLEVDDDPLFGSPWAVTTAQAMAAPRSSQPFAPAPGTDYYWRVRALDSDGDPAGGCDWDAPCSWSETWKARFDPSQGLTPLPATTVQLLRPSHGSEGAEGMPLLEWMPTEGATRYQVQIAQDADMLSLLEDDYAQVSAYISTEPLPYGTYYWRVRAWDASDALGAWSNIWRFQIAAQSRWRLTQPVPLREQSLIAVDASGDIEAEALDLTTLYGAHDSTGWSFGLSVVTSTTPITYVFMLDTNQLDASGGAGDPLYAVATVTGHRPEYALYLVEQNGVFLASRAYLYAWTGGAWGTPARLDAIGGRVDFATTVPSKVQVKVPLTAVGTPGSIALAAFSTTGGGTPADSIPGGSTGTVLSRFTSITQVPMLMSPPSNLTGDPTTHPFAPPFFWQPQVDASAYRFHIQIDRDQDFAAPVDLEQTTIKVASLAETTGFVPEKEITGGDNTYYWRVRVVHRAGAEYGGVFGPRPWRFERLGLAPTSLNVQVLANLPFFSWDITEGTNRFLLQWSTDPGFGAYTQETVQAWEYPAETVLPVARYYWRVRVQDWSPVESAWTYGQPFTTTLPTPTGLIVDPTGVVPRTPTLTWTAYTTPTATARYAVDKYRLQVCLDDKFSVGCVNADTEAASFTPSGYASYMPDGAIYWRVAARDVNGNQGEWAVGPVITKQYPAATLLSPTWGAILPDVPTFQWQPVTGLAYYKIQIDDDPNFGSPDSTETAAAWFTPLKSYATKAWYWRVCGYDKAGKQGPCTDAVLILDPYPIHVNLPLILRD